MNNTSPQTIKYLNKDFASFKQALEDYAKTYYPNTYNDFSPSSPGTMFIDLASYVGDVLSFYQENQIQENFLQYAKEKENLLTMAYMFGYRPKVTSAAIATVDFFQLLPAILSGSDYVPNFNYSLILTENTTVNSSIDPAISFITLNKVDFSYSSSLDPTEISVYQINTNTNQPEYYLLKKSTQAISGIIKTENFTIGAPSKFPQITLTDTDIIKILDIVDSDGNVWYEVPYLAQETIFDEIQNIESNDQILSQNNNVPYLLKLKRVPRRFTTRFTSNNTLLIEFGAGISNTYGILPQKNDETIIPNSDNVGIGLPEGISKLDTAFDPSNFLYTEAYGIAPYNTNLTVRYIVGGGIKSNALSNTINKLGITNILNKSDNVNSNLLSQIKLSIAVNNPTQAVGGSDGNTLEELRLNSIANFSSQLRTVTKEDYIVRLMSLPARYGNLAKAYIDQSKPIMNKPNLLALDLYLLSYNNEKKLTQSTLALKNNVKNFLSQYRMLTDAVNILDAYYINIQIDFDIIVLPNFNNNNVLTECLNVLKEYFTIDKWQINQPIIINDITSNLLKVKGVQNVIKIDITNLSGNQYSPFGYDIKAATKNNVIYPSLDPSIFEVRYPDVNIRGRSFNF